MAGVKEIVVLKSTGVSGIYRVVFRIRSFSEKESREKAEEMLVGFTKAQKKLTRVEIWPVPKVIDTFGYENARVIDLIRPERKR